MTEPPAWPTIRREPARRRRPWLVWGLVPLLAIGLFGLGVAFGQALEDNPDSDDARTQTIVRTLQPREVPLPPPRTTVTVSVPGG